jgi:hypothetical protein
LAGAGRLAFRWPPAHLSVFRLQVALLFGSSVPLILTEPGASLALNASVFATDVARRAGHSVAVLLKIYAYCIDGQADAANKRITDALGSDDTRDDQGQDGQAS